MRKFKSGATRNDNKDKLDFEGFLSPPVIEAYGNYMHKHRKQADGTLRDSDNWQKGFGEKHFSVCIKSAWRHFLDIWKFHRGYGCRETIDEALCGCLFNLMAYYHKLLTDRNEKGNSNEKKKEKKKTKNTRRKKNS